METFQKLPHGGGFGRAVIQAPFQTCIPRQQVHVFGAFTPHRLKEADRLDELGLGKSPLAFAQRQIDRDQAGQAQGTVGPGNAQQARVGAGRFAQRPCVQDEGRLVQER